jgi:hypothetical protein
VHCKLNSFSQGKPHGQGTFVSEKPGSPISRREFAVRAAIASAASLVPATVLTVADPVPITPKSHPNVESSPNSPAEAESQPTPAAPAQQTPNQPALSPESQAEAEARFQTIIAQYGARFSEEQKTDLRRLCKSGQPALDRLRAYSLENGDGPALYLKPLVERDKKSTAPSPGRAPNSTPGAAKPAISPNGSKSSPAPGKP